MQNAALLAFRTILPDNPILTEVEERYRGDWLMRAATDVQPLGVFRPRTTEEVSKALSICHQYGVPVIPQGGRTGLTGGTVPTQGALLLSMERMAQVEELDRVSQLIVVQAGTPLQKIQEAADEAGLLFPLDIGSRGTCQIGGNLSTNAGGNRVLRYGMARAQVLGLEVVLADGTILSSMNRMLKNNAGYDLKQIFIGAEGTLGIITRVILKLAEKPRSQAVALASFKDYPQLERFMMAARAQLGDSLSAFEAMWPEFYDFAYPRQKATPPLPQGAGAYALIEISVSSETAEEQLAALFETAFAQGLVEDAMLAQSLAQTRQIWAIRDTSGDIIPSFDPIGNFDISVSTSRIYAFVEDCRTRLKARWPHAQIIFFGHVVDGNIHIAMGGFSHVELEAVELAVYEVTRDHEGSISAEHGIGLHKRDHLVMTRNAAEIAMMRSIKAALDPTNILNPGKLL